MNDFKTCNTCKQTKPLTSFSKSKKHKDGKCYRCKECDKQHYLSNKNYFKDYQTKYRTERNPDYQKEYYKAVEKIINRQFHSTYGRARNKNLTHTITREWFDTKVAAGHCELTGLPFNYTVKVEGARCMPYLPSIDRIDSSKGYTEDNCRVILWCLNYAFGDYGLEFMKPIFAILAGLKPPVDRL